MSPVGTEIINGRVDFAIIEASHRNFQFRCCLLQKNEHFFHFFFFPFIKRNNQVIVDLYEDEIAKITGDAFPD